MTARFIPDKVTVKKWRRSGELLKRSTPQINRRYQYNEWRALWENHVFDVFHLSFGDLFAGKKVLEVGCGLYGLIHFTPESAMRIGIDPLCGAYKGLWLDANVSHVISTGESLPFNAGTFDVVIIWNVLDYSLEPLSVLREAHRVLNDGGSLLLLVVTYSDAPGWLRKRLSQVDSTRTQHLSHSEMDSLLGKCNLRIRTKTISRPNFFKSVSRNLFSGFSCLSGLKVMFSALVGMEFSYYFCSKSEVQRE